MGLLDQELPEEVVEEKLPIEGEVAEERQEDNEEVTETQEEEEEEEYNLEEHIKDLSGDDEELAELLKEKQERYGLDKNELEKYNDIINDELKEEKEILSKEFDSLTKEEKSELKPTFDILMEKLGDENADFINDMFKSKKGFLGAKKLVESMSQALPSEPIISEKEKEFSMDEYSNFSERIMKAKRELKFDEAEKIGDEMKFEIGRRGSVQMKKDFNLL